MDDKTRQEIHDKLEQSRELGRQANLEADKAIEALRRIQQQRDRAARGVSVFEPVDGSDPRQS